MARIIRQQAIVLSQNKTHVKVSMSCSSACAACHAKSACTSLDQQEKIIDVTCPESEQFNPGELVWVAMHQGMGLKAVAYAYFVPFVLFISSLLISIQLTKNEVISAFISLLVVLFYYIFLYLMRSKLSNSFTFVLQKFDMHV